MRNFQRALVTGGCGFIGSALVRRLAGDGIAILNVDALTYAGDERTVASVAKLDHYAFVKADIADRAAVDEAFQQCQPDVVFHLAAESHVDRSIDGPAAFIQTNVVGTLVMLEAARRYRDSLNGEPRDRFRFVHVSTDEVYGSLGPTGFFSEETAYAPNSPYSASKAAADHLARAWFKTYGLPVVVSNCSNNYGPFQNREKLIPTVIRKALTGQPIPIYGSGQNVRDWLYVDDHVEALLTVGAKGRAGEKYNIGGHNEIKNLDIAETICALLDREKPRNQGSYKEQITFVSDRPGHDFRYAIDPKKTNDELGWGPRETFATGIAKTVRWYLDHAEWALADATAQDRLGLAVSAG